MKQRNRKLRRPKSRSQRVRKTLTELITRLREERTVENLIKSLETALKLEYSTIPPYLCAWWSISGPYSYAATSIREHIAEEEMLHMGLVCNLLVALGADPDLTSTDAQPEYPGQLPGGIPVYDVALQRYSRPALEKFLQIEYPKEGPITDIAGVPEEIEPPEPPEGDGSNTIGQFYEEIWQTFKDLESTLTLQQERQLQWNTGFESSQEGPGVFVITQIDSTEGKNSVEEAIGLITRQGEGSTESPADMSPSDLSHYYRFLELYYEKRITETEPGSGDFEYSGDISQPTTVRPMAVVPSDGYNPQPGSENEELWIKMAEFDRTYTQMLLQIEAAWSSDFEGDNNDRIRQLDEAIKTMFRLGNEAIYLMEQPLPGGSGLNYGPCFRVVDVEIPDVPTLDYLNSLVEDPTWEDNIQYFFTAGDTRCMVGYNRNEYNLSEFELVSRNAGRIHTKVNLPDGDSGLMPQGGPRWDQNRIDTFENWKNNGTPFSSSES